MIYDAVSWFFPLFPLRRDDIVRGGLPMIAATNICCVTEMHGIIINIEININGFVKGWNILDERVGMKKNPIRV